jgi:hypothetical protein
MGLPVRWTAAPPNSSGTDPEETPASASGFPSPPRSRRFDREYRRPATASPGWLPLAVQMHATVPRRRSRGFPGSARAERLRAPRFLSRRRRRRQHRHPTRHAVFHIARGRRSLRGPPAARATPTKAAPCLAPGQLLRNPEILSVATRSGWSRYQWPSNAL